MSDKQLSILLGMIHDDLSKLYQKLEEELAPVIGVEGKNIFGNEYIYVPQILDLRDYISAMDKKADLLRERS